MKITLTMNLPYEPAFGGANKGNRIMAELLARRGHSVTAVVPAIAAPGKGTSCPLIEMLQVQGVLVERRDQLCRFLLNGVDVHAIEGPPLATAAYLGEHLRSFQPDCVLVSSEDSMQLL